MTCAYSGIFVVYRAEIIGIIGASGTLLSGIALLVTITITYKIYTHQRRLSQRQLILPLWEYISNISEIDPKNPVVPDVIKTVNTLELIALLCEGKIIDEQIIRRTFKEQYIRHYENISKCNVIKGLKKNGDDLLRENNAARTFYKKMNDETMNHDKIKN